MPVDEKARGEVDLAIESGIVEFMREDCRRHLIMVVGVGDGGDSKGSSF